MKLSRLIAVGLMSAAALLPSAGHATPVVDTHNSVGGSDCNMGDETLAWDSANVEWDASTSITCSSGKVMLDVQFAVQEIEGFAIAPAPSLSGPVIFTSQNPSGTNDFACSTSPCKTITATGSQLSLDANRVYVVTSWGYVQQMVTQRGKQVVATFNGKHSTCFLVTGQAQAPIAIPGCEG